MSDAASKPKVYKPRPVTGFPEWLPEVRLIEQQWFDHIRRVFESYGFCSIETPSVEELDVLRAKGEVDKEIYVIERLHKDENDKSDARLALHFDQTVPLARYVAQNFNDLVFPFKRYQMQRVWRGERPQAGRFREFYQCDIDVIGVDNLPLHFDAELPAIMWEVMNGLPGMENEKIQIRISNRRILQEVMRSLGYTHEQDNEYFRKACAALDKLEKIGEAEVKKLLIASGIVNGTDCLIQIASIKTSSTDELDRLITEAMGYINASPSLFSAINELQFVLNGLNQLPKQAAIADLSIVRGLDYYTGTVYETVFLDDPSYGSICSGGRYDDLASSYISKKLPGVGISIGFSRLFARMVDQKKIDTSRKSPADVMVMMPSEEQRPHIIALCRTLRENGLKVEMYHAAKKFPDQLKYASRKGIPFVLITEEDGTYKIKDMITGDQSEVDPKTWTPPTRKALDHVA